MMDDFGNLRRVQPTKPVEKFSRNQILGASSGWVAVVLNILPGLGAGYIYQRRWKAYWLTSVVSSLWVLIGLIRQLKVESADLASIQSDQVGFYGLFAIAAITACEAGVAVKNVREALTKKLE